MTIQKFLISMHMFEMKNDKELHTGPAKNPLPNSDFKFMEEQIPNSQIKNVAGHWYLYLDTMYTYRIEIIGKTNGYLVLEIKDSYEKQPIIISYPGALLTATSLQDLPKKLPKVTPSFRAKMTIPSHFTELPLLSIDAEGDGKYETQLKGAICKYECY